MVTQANPYSSLNARNRLFQNYLNAQSAQANYDQGGTGGGGETSGPRIQRSDPNEIRSSMTGLSGLAGAAGKAAQNITRSQTQYGAQNGPTTPLATGLNGLSGLWNQANGGGGGGGGGVIGPDGSSGGGGYDATGAPVAAAALADADPTTERPDENGFYGSSKATTDFGRQFNPGYNSDAWDNPKDVVQQYFNYKELPRNSGGLAVANQQADRSKLLWMLANEGQSQETPGWLDWTGKFLDNQFTPGGTSFGAKDILSQMMSADESRPVWNNLYGSGLTPTQQVGNFLSTMKTGMNGSIPTPILNAMLARVDDLGGQFSANRMTQPDGGGNFGDFLRENGFTPEQFG